MLQPVTIVGTQALASDASPDNSAPSISASYRPTNYAATDPAKAAGT